jgi:radical SAM protein with 4Fe4S-binding SPASM domain
MRAFIRKDNSATDFGDRHFVDGFVNVKISKEDTDLICDNIINTRKEMFNIFGNQLAIVPTTECHGRCTYCYAAAKREFNSGYITKETLKKSLDIIYSKNGGKEIDEVIVYGGDPGVDTQGLKDMVASFSPNTSICLVTGLLYSQELFDGLKEVIKSTPNVSCCLSIDALCEDGSYNRVFNFGNSKSTYENLIDRAAELLQIDLTRIAIRPTVTNNSYRFDKLRDDVLKVAGLTDNFQLTVELVDHEELDQEVMEFLKSKITEFWDMDIKVSPSKRFVHDILNDTGFLYNMYGDCDQLFGRVTIGPQGEFHGCPNSPVQTDQFLVDGTNDFINSTNDELKEIRTKLWDKCFECDFVEYCSGFCYIVAPTDSRCDWRSFNICEGIYQSIKGLTDEELNTLSRESMTGFLKMAELERK